MPMFGTKNIANKVASRVGNEAGGMGGALRLLGGSNGAVPGRAEGGLPWLTYLLGGSSAVDRQREQRERQANAPIEEAKRRLLMEQINRQLGAYGVADTANLTDEEKIALAFNPGELGKSFASGSDAYTLGRNDRRGFRNQEVMRNDAPPDPQVVGPGASLIGGDGQIVFRAPQFQAVPESSRLVQTDPGTGGGAPGGGFDAFYQNFLAPQEGGFAPDDGNGAPVNFGINQGANPDVDVRNLTQDQAKKLLHDRYWAASGADKLPGGLAEIHGDTAVNMGVGAAQQLLQQSGGDPNRYLQLREQRYQAIAQADPSKARFLPTWMRRNQQLAQYVGGGQPAQPAQGGPRVVVDAAPKKQDAPPQGYRWGADGSLQAIPGGPADPATKKPGGRATAAVLALQDEHLSALNIASGVRANLERLEGQIAGGKLNLGPVTNLISQGRNAIGASDPNSRNFASFRANLEKLRNDSLRLNKGVQTEGDAQRAWNELMANISDEKVVLQRLREINELNRRAEMFRAGMVEQIREDAGLAPMDPNRFKVQPQGPSQPRQPSQLPQRAPAAPKVGEVRKGYRFKGGDPSSPSSWVKAQ